MERDGRMPDVAKHRAANTLPFFGPNPAIVAVAVQDPDGGIRLPARHHVSRQSDGLIIR